MEKIVNADIKTSFEPPLEMKKINSRCSKAYKPAKSDKDKANQDH